MTMASGAASRIAETAVGALAPAQLDDEEPRTRRQHDDEKAETHPAARQVLVEGGERVGARHAEGDDLGAVGDPREAHNALGAKSPAIFVPGYLLISN
jgi:hypothetical protein